MEGGVVTPIAGAAVPSAQPPAADGAQTVGPSGAGDAVSVALARVVDVTPNVDCVVVVPVGVGVPGVAVPAGVVVALVPGVTAGVVAPDAPVPVVWAPAARLVKIVAVTAKQAMTRNAPAWRPPCLQLPPCLHFMCALPRLFSPAPVATQGSFLNNVRHGEGLPCCPLERQARLRTPPRWVACVAH